MKVILIGSNGFLANQIGKYFGGRRRRKTRKSRKSKSRKSRKSKSRRRR